MWGSGFRVQGSGFSVDGVGCRVKVSEFMFWGSGLGNAGRMVQGSRFTVYGSEILVKKFEATPPTEESPVPQRR